MIAETELHDMEVAACEDESMLHQMLAKCVSEVRRLQHELDDPNYQYSGGRIHRQALLSRDAQIARMGRQLCDLAKKVP